MGGMESVSGLRGLWLDPHGIEPTPGPQRF